MSQFNPNSAFAAIRRFARPMLARDADSLYWMSRYVERAEHVARLLLVNSNLLIDVGDLSPRTSTRLWQSLLTVFRLPELCDSDDSIAQRVAQSLSLSAENPNSIVSCLTLARENARRIREHISAEMWECINTLYWSIRADDSALAARFEDSPADFYRTAMNGSMLFQGLTDQTLPHEQRWHFAQLAKYSERIDITARVIETKFHILQDSQSQLDSAVSYAHWMAVLRSCCSIEAYRRQYLGEMDPLQVAAFLILERDFPRSIRFCAAAAHAAIADIGQETNPGVPNAALRILGRLDSQLQYAQMPEILKQGLPKFLGLIQTEIYDATQAVQQEYFLY